MKKTKTENHLPDLHKRQFLRMAIVVASVSGTGCASLMSLGGAKKQTPDFLVYEKTSLTTKQQRVFTKIAQLIVPASSSLPSLESVGFMGNVEAILSGMSPENKKDILLGLKWFDVSSVFSYRLSGFSSLNEKGAQTHMNNWLDKSGYKRAIANSLYSITVNAYWRNNKAASAVGYRPETQDERNNLPIF